VLDIDLAILGSGFGGSLLAMIARRLGYRVMLLERGRHPRFAIGESSTPLANLSLERIAAAYGLADCAALAAYGRWAETFPEVRRGLKRGFTFYRHHPGQSPDDARLAEERLLVAASPTDHIADSHWLRADVDHHFVREAQAAGVDYRDRVEVTDARVGDDEISMCARRDGADLEIHADFVIDASGPGGFLARQLSIASGLASMETRSASVFSHFDGVRLMSEIAPALPAGPYPDDWAAVHHMIDEGWMYSLRFDHGVTSAGFVLSPRGVATLAAGSADEQWSALLGRYPVIAAAFDGARPTMPIMHRDRIQHRLMRAAGPRWALLPHAFAFVDPLFSTGIAWSLRAIERLASMFEANSGTRAIPNADELDRYARMLTLEADQIDHMVAAAYEAMAHFDLFAAHAMLYFATVSFSEVKQRVVPSDDVAWGGFLGVGDAVLEPLARESLRRLREITRGEGQAGSEEDRREYVEWAAAAIAPRNVAGLADPARHNLYPVDLDVLIERHSLLGMSREQLMEALPTLRGMAPEPVFADPRGARRSISPPGPRATAPPAPAPR